MEKKFNCVSPVNDYLRHLENEFLNGIGAELGKEWNLSSTILKPQKNAVNITFFIHRRSHIMMSHGLADKNYLFRTDKQGGFEINKYHYICVPGIWLKNRILNTPGMNFKENQIKVVGWPRIDALLEAQKKYNLKQKTKHLDNKKLNVLWAPTHGGGQKDKIFHSSYPGLLKYEEQLKRLFSYDCALHPGVSGSKESTFEKLLKADIVISDKGTLVYEAWALGKPVIFPSWLIREGILTKTPNTAEAYIFEKNIGLHANSFEELVKIIQNNPEVGNDVTLFLNEYLDKTTYGKSYRLIADVVEEVWNSGDLKVKPKVGTSTETV